MHDNSLATALNALAALLAVIARVAAVPDRFAVQEYHSSKDKTMAEPLAEVAVVLYAHPLNSMAPIY